jgi:hypothetical protein
MQTQDDVDLQRSVLRIVLTALLLPPFIGGTLMGVAGFYPLPEFYLIFLSYTGLYVLAVLAIGVWGARRLGQYLIELSYAEPQEAELRARRLFKLLP